MIACALIVAMHPGGLVADHAAAVRVLSAAGCEVRLEGDCRSACTMLLAVPGACVTPAALLTFHAPRARDGSPLAPTAADHWVAEIARHYPPALRRWFLDEGRYQTATITGATLIALGVPACEELTQ
jgi:hypothetical protein